MREINLKVMDYVFTYKEEDLTCLSLQYDLEKCNHEIHHKNGNKEVKKVEIINFKFKLCDKDKNEYILDFELEKDMKYFNSLSCKQTDISSYVGELYFTHKVRMNYSPITPSENDIYHPDECYYLAKISDSDFIIKLDVPEFNVFTWFKVSLNELN